MESWQLLQLEPSALREPDDMNAPYHLDPNGRHLPATLHHLANVSSNGDRVTPADPDRLFPGEVYGLKFGRGAKSTARS